MGIREFIRGLGKEQPVSKDRREFLASALKVSAGLVAERAGLLSPRTAEAASYDQQPVNATEQAPNSEVVGNNTIVLSELGNRTYGLVAEVDTHLGALAYVNTMPARELTTCRIDTALGKLTISNTHIPVDTLIRMVEEAGGALSQRPTQDANLSQADVHGIPMELEDDEVKVVQRFTGENGEASDSANIYVAGIGCLPQKGKVGNSTMYLMESIRVVGYDSQSIPLEPGARDILRKLHPNTSIDSWKPGSRVAHFRLLDTLGVNSDQSVTDILLVNIDNSRSITIKTRQGNSFELTLGNAEPSTDLAKRINDYDSSGKNSSGEYYRDTITVPMVIKKNGILFHQGEAQFVVYVDDDYNVESNPHKAIMLRMNEALDQCAPVFLQAIRHLTPSDTALDNTAFDQGLINRDLQRSGGG